MNTRSLTTALVLLALAGGPAQAQQGDKYVGFAYTPVLPTGNTADYAGDWSWRGATFEARKIVQPNVSVGFSAGWHVFNDETDEVSSFEREAVGVDIQGTQFRYINSFPLLINAHYYLGERGGLRPFIGADLGITYVEQRVEIGLIALTQDAWPFTLGGDVGLAFPLGWQTAGFLFARFHWMAAAGNLEEQTYWAFGVGAAWQ